MITPTWCFLLLLLSSFCTTIANYHISNIDTDIRLHDDCWSTVSETITFQFNGAYKVVGRPIPDGITYGTTQISDFEATSPSKNVNITNVQVERSGNNTYQVVKFNNDQKQSNVTFLFKSKINLLRYDALQDKNLIFWNYKWSSPIRSLNLKVHFPKYWGISNKSSSCNVESSFSNTVLRAKRTRVLSGEEFFFNVTFDTRSKDCSESWMSGGAALGDHDDGETPSKLVNRSTGVIIICSLTTALCTLSLFCVFVYLAAPLLKKRKQYIPYYKRNKKKINNEYVSIYNNRVE
ncbi:solute carrier family 35 member [Acrasis kona]|uniref:Solute carrier family 35 member n=1 Tax=Acrasis kona TaxID=1008807 RepID=A0AAW2ZF65_9EUKA